MCNQCQYIRKELGTVDDHNEADSRDMLALRTVWREWRGAGQ